jgi:hypothetical protein
VETVSWRVRRRTDAVEEPWFLAWSGFSGVLVLAVAIALLAVGDWLPGALFVVVGCFGIGAAIARR